MSDLLAEFVSEFKGTYPDVPFAPGVDAEGIRSDDPSPFFVTLPLTKIGSKSHNGFTWDEAGTRRLVEEINAKKPEGVFGHLKPDERSHRYDLPKLRWVGAILVDGVAYGKAYVPQYAPDVREHFRIAKRTNARVGTSVYGMRGDKGLANMSIEEIDAGHPDRLGTPDAAAIPQITSELAHTEDNPVDENQLITELRTDRDTARTRVSELEAAARENAVVIAELQQKQSAYDALVSELALGDKPLETAKAIVSELTALRTEKAAREINDVLVSEVKNEAVRPYIHKLLTAKDAASAKVQIAELLADPLIIDLSKKLIVEMRGGSAHVRNERDNGELQDTPESRAAARQHVGI